MPSVGPRAKHWAFTLNNYTANDVARLTAVNASVSYMVFGEEIAPSGTPHLQGTVCFKDRKSMLQVKAYIGNTANVSVVRFLPQSIDYCKKDGKWVEWGVPPNTGKKGEKRSDLEDFKNSVKEGVTNLAELRELHSEVCARYMHFVTKYIQDHRPPIRVEAFPLRPWQQALNQVLLTAPDTRTIMFVVDTEGNQGKSWFAGYYCELHSNAQIIVPGRKADMAYVVDQESRVFFMDCPRSKQGEFIQYDFLEELKTGRVFSPKYESVVKRLNPVHVVVMTNERPDMSKLSQDRYKIVEIP